MSAANQTKVCILPAPHKLFISFTPWREEFEYSDDDPNDNFHIDNTVVRIYTPRANDPCLIAEGKYVGSLDCKSFVDWNGGTVLFPSLATVVADLLLGAGSIDALAEIYPEMNLPGCREDWTAVQHWRSLRSRGWSGWDNGTWTVEMYSEAELAEAQAALKVIDQESTHEEKGKGSLRAYRWQGEKRGKDLETLIAESEYLSLSEACDMLAERAIA